MSGEGHPPNAIYDGVDTDGTAQATLLLLAVEFVIVLIRLALL